MYWVNDGSHAWLVVPKGWANNICGDRVSSSSYESRLRKLAYLEEDVDAPLFLQEAGVVGEHPTQEINDFEDYRRRHKLVQFRYQPPKAKRKRKAA